MNIHHKLFVFLLMGLFLTGCSRKEEVPAPVPAENAPVITGFTPAHGGVSTTITIQGSNFSALSQNNTVKFNGITAKILSVGATQISVQVPAGATTGNISVETKSGKAETKEPFILDGHTLTGVTRELIKGEEEVNYSGPGEKLLITGNNFSRILSENQVKFNGLPAEVSPVPSQTEAGPSATQLYITLPQGASTGKITITIGELTAESPQTITIPPGYWAKLPEPFPGSERESVVSFTIDTKAYVGGGALNTANGFQFFNDFWEFDPASGKWKRIADFPGPGRKGGVTFTIGNKAYIASGTRYEGNALTDMWEYDPATNIWTPKANLYDDRYNGVAFSIGDKGYMTLGPDKQLWEYSPLTDQWLRKADFPGTIISSAQCFVLQDVAYVGATGANGMAQYSNEVWAYSPATNTWNRKADFPGGVRTEALSFALNGKGYVGGGNGNYSLWQYDPLDDKWMQSVPIISHLPNNAIYFCIGNKGYTGSTRGSYGYYDAQKSFWEFNP